eukprot:TRINITY_DN17915_c0_g1_i1.p1 TRINITY_DN17915_c0_g1~~TRINITY_DN17915_c0_g1_i1.p1  ORF type:complete len:479 (+),score=118.79 TRINITY_DN17915_c0_g1_i1:176-1438(+)
MLRSLVGSEMCIRDSTSTHQQAVTNPSVYSPLPSPSEPNLTAERLGAMVLFERYDTDGDGQIDLEEASKMVRDLLPATRQKVSDEWVRGQARRMLVQMDLDHNGKIDLEEFLVYSRENPEVFGRLASASLQQRTSSGQREEFQVSVARSAESAKSSPRRVLQQIDRVRQNSNPVSPPKSSIGFRAGSEEPSPSPTKSPNLTPASSSSYQDNEWHTLFMQYDLDGNGQLDVHEVTLLISDLLPKTTRPPNKDWVQSQASSMMRRMDADQDGLIDFREFIAYARNSHQLGDLLSRRGAFARSMSPHVSHIKRNDDRVEDSVAIQPTEVPEIREEWAAIFSRFDVDQNRTLDLREIEMMIAGCLPDAEERETLPVDTLKWIRRTARRMLVEMDTDGNGAVDYSEFLGYMQKHNISSKSMLRGL